MDFREKYRNPNRLDDDPAKLHAVYALQELSDGSTPRDLFFKMHGDEMMAVFKQYLDEDDYAFIERERSAFLRS